MATYSLDQTGPVQKQAGAIQPGRLATTGGNVAAPQQMTATASIDTRTTDAIMKLGGAVIEQRLEKQQAEQFLKGAQAVHQGDSLQEVIDQQPWYTQIFGPSASVRGAQQIAMINAQEELTTGLLRDMDSLRKLPPEDFGQQVRRRQMEGLTGDATTDAILMTKMVETTGPLYRQHAKEHYKYGQEVMQQETIGMITTTAQTLREAGNKVRDGVMSAEDMRMYRDNALASLTPLSGQSPESYWGAVFTGLEDQLAQGNHHFAAALWDSGLIEHMPAEERIKAIALRDTAEAKTLSRVGYLEYGAALADLATSEDPPEVIAREVLRINEDARLKYGVTGDVISRDAFVGNLRAAELRRRSERRSGNSAEEKAAAEARYQRELVSNIVLGRGVDAQVPTADQQAALSNIAQDLIANGRVDHAMEVLTKQASLGLVDPFLRNQFQAPFRLGESTQGPTEFTGSAAEAAIAMFDKMVEAPGGGYAVQEYFGDYAKGIATYREQLALQVPHTMAWEMSFGQKARYHNPVETKDVDSALKKAVGEVEPGIFSRVFGAIGFNDDTRTAIIGAMEPYMKAYMETTYLTPDQAAAAAMREVQANNDVVGSLLIRKGKGAPTLTSLLGVGQEDVGKVILREVAKQGREIGLNTRVMEDALDFTLSDLPLGSDNWRDFTAWRHGERDFSRPIAYRDDRVDPATGRPYATILITVQTDTGPETILVDTRKITNIPE